MARAGARSSLSLPLPVQDEAIGALNVYAAVPNAFDEAAARLGQEFAAYAAVAVANAVSFSTAADAARNLQAAMENRAVIEQAKGILIATTGCDAESAFRLLVQQSQHENRKLREIAIELVERSITA
jgi:GAF domain-containing protein